MQQDFDWTYEETILAMDCYVNDLGRQMPKREDSHVKELSELLNSLSIHPRNDRKDNFRTADAVHMRISMIADIDPESNHRGRGRSGAVYPHVWRIYANRPKALRKVAGAIADAFADEAAKS